LRFHVNNSAPERAPLFGMARTSLPRVSQESGRFFFWLAGTRVGDNRNVTEQDTAETAHLLDQVQAGNRQALDILLERHRSFLRRIVTRCLDLRLGGRFDASDVVQESQVEVYRRLDDYLRRRPMPFRLWLWKTAYQRALALQRRHWTAQRRTVQREIPLPDRSSLLLARPFQTGSTASRHLSRGELTQRVRQALARLPAADREVLVMRVYDGLSNQEIGAIINLDPASVSKRHGRALVRLHRLLAANGVAGCES
jgi:RNA polymerase sigma-70 factor (ECF subfamily)